MFKSPDQTKKNVDLYSLCFCFCFGFCLFFKSNHVFFSLVRTGFHDFNYPEQQKTGRQYFCFHRQLRTYSIVFYPAKNKQTRTFGIFCSSGSSSFNL